MKHVISALVLCGLILSIPAMARGHGIAPQPVALVPGQYDRIEGILDSYRIPYERLSYRDLEKKELFPKYRAIFLPCGVKKAPEDNISVSAQGWSIQNVILKQDYDNVDTERIVEHLYSFINDGGSAYISDYSYFLLQGEYKPFSFFDGFPNMGISGNFTARLNGSLRDFCNMESVPVSFSHSGWIALKSIGNAKILAEGELKTAGGDRNGPLIAHMEWGRGDAIYTSFHSSDPENPLMRFIIYRLCFRYLLDRQQDDIYRWEQRINGSIIDAVHTGESSRSYSVMIRKGANSISFLSEGGLFQVDLFDPQNGLLISSDHPGRSFTLEVRLPEDRRCTLRIYPSRGEYYAPYAITVASGTRFLPHVSKIIYLSAFIFALTIIILLVKLLNPKRTPGRLYHTFDRFKTR